jgi:hypothetical protein
MPRDRRIAPLGVTAALVATVAAAPAHAQERWLLQGLFDTELWETDSDSRLLSDNEGSQATEGQLTLWLATELDPSVQLVVIGALTGGNAEGQTEVATTLEQALVRTTFGRNRRLMLEAGRVPQTLGNFANRYRADVNPLIGGPTSYTTSYPQGIQFAGSVKWLDFTAGYVDRPLINEGWVPDYDSAFRPTLDFGLTPTVGLRLGAYATEGPYLNENLQPTLAPGSDWKDFDQRVVGFDLHFSRGYLELNGDYNVSSYEVPIQDRLLRGEAYYIEPKYTFSPRFFTALRLESNKYPFIRLDENGWLARESKFYDFEIGVGYRFGASSLVKASYRQDFWQVDPAMRSFFPDGYAVAVQFSQTFDVRSWFEPGL